MTPPCPELETLFAGLNDGDETIASHVAECDGCAALLEEHRQLEKDLFRIVDPLPPPDFTHRVMAKVADAPAPIAAEVRVGLGVLLCSVSLFVALLFSGGHSLGSLGATVAHGLVEARTFLVALANGLQVTWATAAIPLVALCFGLLLLSLLGLRKLASAPQSA